MKFSDMCGVTFTFKILVSLNTKSGRNLGERKGDEERKPTRHSGEFHELELRTGTGRSSAYSARFTKVRPGIL